MHMFQMGTAERMFYTTPHKLLLCGVRELYFNLFWHVKSYFAVQPVGLSDDAVGFRVFGDQLGNTVIVTRTVRHINLDIWTFDTLLRWRRLRYRSSHLQLNSSGR